MLCTQCAIGAFVMMVLKAGRDVGSRNCKVVKLR